MRRKICGHLLLINYRRECFAEGCHLIVTAVTALAMLGGQHDFILDVNATVSQLFVVVTCAVTIKVLWND
jgi:hypothetical protein